MQIIGLDLPERVAILLSLAGHKSRGEPSSLSDLFWQKTISTFSEIIGRRRDLSSTGEVLNLSGKVLEMNQGGWNLQQNINLFFK